MSAYTDHQCAGQRKYTVWNRIDKTSLPCKSRIGGEDIGLNGFAPVVIYERIEPVQTPGHKIGCPYVDDEGHDRFPGRVVISEGINTNQPAQKCEAYQAENTYFSTGQQSAAGRRYLPPSKNHRQTRECHPRVSPAGNCHAPKWIVRDDLFPESWVPFPQPLQYFPELIEFHLHSRVMDHDGGGGL